MKTKEGTWLNNPHQSHTWFRASGWAHGQVDEVAAKLRADGHDVTALTLPGMESKDADRSEITFEDHVNAIIEAVEAAGTPVVLTVHSARGSPAMPSAIASRSGSRRWSTSTPRPGLRRWTRAFEDAEKPMVWSEIEAEENLDGLSKEQKETFRTARRSGPRPRPEGFVRADERRSPGHPEHPDLHGVHGGAVPDVREAGGR